MDLFGGDRPWCSSEWTASDDRVRGGASHSYLDYDEGPPSTACFHGTLDIETLGGAGFASQRTTTDSKSWDLSAYEGVVLQLGKSDGKKYTFILKDEILAPSPEGREQSTVSWEYDFDGPTDDECTLRVLWKNFKPTYRGREKKDAAPIKLTSIRRMSFMMRSFFGSQQGDFFLTLRSVSTLGLRPPTPDIASTLSQELSLNEKRMQPVPSRAAVRFRRRVQKLFKCFG